jgi:very-short-patch-repair endonuclease
MHSGAWMKLARRQAGVLSRAQLLMAGLSARQSDLLVRRGVLLRAGRGVLRLAGAPWHEHTALWIAMLSTQGILIGPSAAAVWGLTPAPHVVWVAIPPGRRVVAPDGVRVLRTFLPASDVTERFGLRVTTRRRSALDHLALSPVAEATVFADRALSQGWLRLPDLQRRLTSRTRGNPVIRKVLATVLTGAEAESERRLHRLLRSAGITGWAANHPVTIGGRLVARIDLAFVARRIAIEVDGFAYHSDRARFQRDRSRQNLLVGLGWTVLRFTWSDLNDRPDEVLAVICAALRNT